MASPQTTTEAIQLVGRDGNASNVFDEHGMRTLITSSNATKDPYIVVSIIGPQSSGKSTLMNGIFNTQFTVMDASKEWSRTTMGIWASICNNSRAVVLDVEGIDSDDNQDDLGFEIRSALFALVISDIIIFNICIGEVNRANSNPLLIKIFEEVVKKAGAQGLPEQNETKFVVAVRNYDGETPEKNIMETITSKINKIWKSIPQTENSKLEKYFKLHIELFPNYKHEKAKFNKKCEEIRGGIARGDWVNIKQSSVFIFPSEANEMWKAIMNNNQLDLPSHRETMARTTCGTIMSEKLKDFQSIEYPKLTSTGYDNPRKFISQLERILKDILFKYESETQVYGKYAEEEKENLKTNILHHANGEFKSVMERFEKKTLEDTTKGIDLECEKRTSDLKERIDSVVTKYRNEYLLKSEDLNLYDLNKENFLEKLNFIGTKRTADIKKTSSGKALHITKSVMLALATAGTAVAVVATGPLGVLVGTTAAAVTAVTAVAVLTTASGAAAAISAVQGQPHNYPNMFPVEADMHGNTEATNTSEPLLPSK